MANLTIKQAQAKIETKAEMAARELITDTFRGVIRRTPVVTGRTISNWFAALRRPRRRIRKRTSAFNAFALDTVTKTMARFKVGMTAYLTNGLFHTRILEDGDVRTRPRGMVKLTVAELSTRAARVAAALRRK